MFDYRKLRDEARPLPPPLVGGAKAITKQIGARRLVIAGWLPAGQTRRPILMPRDPEAYCSLDAILAATPVGMSTDQWAGLIAELLRAGRVYPLASPPNQTRDHHVRVRFVAPFDAGGDGTLIATLRLEYVPAKKPDQAVTGICFSDGILLPSDPTELRSFFEALYITSEPSARLVRAPGSGTAPRIVWLGGLPGQAAPPGADLEFAAIAAANGLEPALFQAQAHALANTPKARANVLRERRAAVTVLWTTFSGTADDLLGDPIGVDVLDVGGSTFAEALDELRVLLPDQPISELPKSAEDGFLAEVRSAYQRMYAGADLERFPLRDVRLGPEFITTLNALQGVSDDRVYRVCAHVACGREDIPGLEVHAVRTGEGGNDPPLVRSRDGARAMRASLQSHSPAARRLHYWSGQSPTGRFVEFASVDLHDRFDVPSS